MKIDDKKLAEALVANKLVTEKNAKALLENATRKGVSLETILFERETIPDEKYASIIAEMYKIPLIRVGDKTITEQLLRIVPYALASHQFVIPFEKTGTEINLAMNNPTNYELINFIEKKTGLSVNSFYATKKDIKTALKAYHRDVNTKFTKLLKGALADPTKIESLQDAAKILDTTILFAFQNNASDIHIEPHKDFLLVRYRIDGILQTITELPIEILDLLTTRVKVLANLRTDEHRTPQDGRFKIELENNEITLRVSIVPTYDGEKTVMRLLSSTSQELNLESLGYSKDALKVIQRNILKTHGIILMTGPTGSGKTTTLYAILKLLNSPEVNIATIEDPIEYRLEGINQIQVNPKTKLTFATGLRSIVRQDPDILMVGEIRDEETADIAINAALTGHLVLATLHTNDAASTLPRMLEMKVESFLLAATVQMAIAQRLVRTICDKCKKEYKVTMQQLKTLGEKFNISKNFEKIIQYLIEKNPKLKAKVQDDSIIFYKGEGCESCNHSGYKGRTCIAEVMEASENLKKLILKNSSPTEIQTQAIKEGMVTMFVDGIEKVLKGKTTIEEVLRVMRV